MRVAMSGTYENGCMIAVFVTRDQAEAWIEKMVDLLETEGLHIEKTELEEINTKFRAGVIFKKQQLEFDI